MRACLERAWSMLADFRGQLADLARARLSKSGNDWTAASSERLFAASA